MSQTTDRSVSIRTAFKQMPRATALDICDDYREVVTRLKRLADNLAAVFVISSCDSARAPKQNSACLKTLSIPLLAA